MLGASGGSLLTRLHCQTALSEYRKSINSAFLDLNRGESVNSHLKMKALVVCRNHQTIGILSHLFREVGVETQICETESSLLDHLRSNKYEALVVDFDDLSGSAEIVKSARDVRPNKDIALFAIASNSHMRAAALTWENTFMVRRPLVLSEVRSLLRTVYGRMVRSSQEYFRMNAEIPVTLARAHGPVLQCTTVNISQNGMAIMTPAPLDRGELLHLVFAIPQTDVVVSAEGTVIWDNSQGKAGIRFECSAASTQARLFEWLNNHFRVKLNVDV